MEQENDPMWNMAASVAAMAATAVAMRVMRRGWVSARGALPGNPAKGESSWGEATIWAISTGVVIGVARVAAERGVAAYFEGRRAESRA